MLMMSRVCAEFHDAAGTVLFTVRPADLMLFIEAPDSIKQDPLFEMLVRDGSIEVPLTKEERKKLENDPEIHPEVTENAGKTETAAAEVTAEKASGRKSK